LSYWAGVGPQVLQELLSVAVGPWTLVAVEVHQLATTAQLAAVNNVA